VVLFDGEDKIAFFCCFEAGDVENSMVEAAFAVDDDAVFAHRVVYHEVLR
jgi:hypothetical protein